MHDQIRSITVPTGDDAGMRLSGVSTDSMRERPPSADRAAFDACYSGGEFDHSIEEQQTWRVTTTSPDEIRM
ncbi:hypothetical protein ACQB60_13925 [Actinomycetota bacterium Odt1-20B]